MMALGRKQIRRPSFRVRMVLFSVLVSGFGLFVFALLALGFFQRELRQSLVRELSGALVQSAPVLLRSLEDRGSRAADWMAARIEGRLDQFGASYAVRVSELSGWVFSDDWPEKDNVSMNRAVEKLPETALTGIQRQERPSEDRQRSLRPDPRRIRGMLSNVGVLQPSGWPSEWLVAGLRLEGAVVCLAVRGDLNHSEMRRLAAVFLITGPVALGLVGMGAFFLAGRALTPIRRLTDAASRIGAADLSQRIETTHAEREFHELIEKFNEMLNRLEKSFQQARRFGQDAAHELNTPLTVLTARIDDAVKNAETGSSEQIHLVGIGEELGRMREIVRKLELLARIDGGGFQPEKESFALRSLSKDVVAELAEIFTAIEFHVENGDEVEVLADRGLARQILLNLMSNGARYNREGGRVHLAIEKRETHIRTIVSNTGPAIPGELSERIFERFSRGDPARQHGKGGLGLGLSLAREFARAMDGDLKLVNGTEDSICFEWILPTAERAGRSSVERVGRA